MTELATRFQQAIALVEAGDYAKAEAICRTLTAVAPAEPSFLFLRGLIRFHLGDMETAVADIRDAIAIDPDNASYHATLGAFLIETGARDAAVPALERAVALQPDDMISSRHLGRQYSLAGRLRDSAAIWQRICATETASAGDFLALGQAKEAIQALEAACAAYRQALDRAPENVVLHNHLGACSQKLGRLGDAMAAYGASLQKQPDGNPAVLGLLTAKQVACDWAEFDAWTARADALTDASIVAETAGVEDPFTHVTRCDDPAKNFAVARLWSGALSERIAGWGVRFDYRRHDGPIRIGYLSSDFHDHATAHLMAGLFAAHDRRLVSIHAYSAGPDDGSDYRRAIAADCDSFTDIAALDGIAAAKTINGDGIDILVDLKGYTRHNRLEIAALRPAPVQIAWLGFPGTSGADFFDYIITDDVVTPPEVASFYSEAFAVMPHSYQVNNDRQAMATISMTRQDCGIGDDAIVLASFNNTYKLEPAMFALWIEILKVVPSSVLWLLANNELAKRNLCAAASDAGVAPRRLIFAEHLSKDRHLGRLALADLGLDTRIYNGHTTTSDALWAGLPVVALQGRHFASRVSASLLSAFGLPELITHSLEDYRDLAVSLAGDSERLNALKTDVIRRRGTSALFATAQFAADLDRAYGEMWRRHRAGESARRLVVADY